MDLVVKVKKRFSAFFLDADFTIQGDEIGVFGPSGGGKSTLVSLIAGLRHPDQGFISLDGETLFDSSRGLHMPPERRRIGMVFQRPHLFPHLSVKSNLLYGYKRCDTEYRKITLDSVVDVMQIGSTSRQRSQAPVRRRKAEGGYRSGGPFKSPAPVNG